MWPNIPAVAAAHMDTSFSNITTSSAIEEPIARPINSLYLYIPFVIFVFLAPLMFISLLCYIQRRNKRMQQNEMERLNNRRLSTAGRHSIYYNGSDTNFRKISAV
ncbi:unnamed protein product [Bursaphelenchus xylophilus]|uniref:(pine wood nematode) hypothetical protein n=1 Tax=Bursaphelenchus xylophilus TaxID=6326 RepID=A0A1I7SKY9_BURXY|nr:unnamed protein product [Bursaphelenchus xylophilus]CAG9129304.1 unnamed protein product [Bursaphelenchus xylophilus]